MRQIIFVFNKKNVKICLICSFYNCMVFYHFCHTYQV